MIDGSEKRKRQLPFEVKSSRVFEKRSKSVEKLASSRLSDSGEDAKVKGTVQEAGFSSRFIFLFAVLNSAGPTISEPGTGCRKIYEKYFFTVFKPVFLFQNTVKIVIKISF